VGLKKDIEFFSKFFNVSRETMDSFLRYEDLLIQHNSKVNLIGKSTLNKIWMRHFADSAKIFEIITSIMKKKDKETYFICDIGSGAGFPGLVLSILNQDLKFNMDITLIESNKKKCSFIRSIRDKLRLSCKIRNIRAEYSESRYDIIVARAVAPLEKLSEIAHNMKKEDTSFIFPQGANWSKQVAQLKKKWNFDMNIVKNNIMIDQSGGVTLILKGLEKK